MIRKVLPLMLAVALVLSSGQASYAGSKKKKKTFWKIVAVVVTVGIAAPVLFGSSPTSVYDERTGNEYDCPKGIKNGCHRR